MAFNLRAFPALAPLLPNSLRFLFLSQAVALLLILSASYIDLRLAMYDLLNSMSAREHILQFCLSALLTRMSGITAQDCFNPDGTSCNIGAPDFSTWGSIYRLMSPFCLTTGAIYV